MSAAIASDDGLSSYAFRGRVEFNWNVWLHTTFANGRSGRRVEFGYRKSNAARQGFGMEQALDTALP